VNLRKWGVFGLAGIAGIAGITGIAGSWLYTHRPRSALDAVPPDAMLVATLDTSLLRKTPLFGLLRALLARAYVLPTDCPIVPSEAIDSMAFAMAPGAQGDFGVALTGRASVTELERCRDALFAQAGAKIGAASYERVGDFDVWAGPALRVGLSQRGPLLVGRGAYLGEFAKAATSAGARIEHDSPQGLLQQRLFERAAGSPVAWVSVLLPDGLPSAMAVAFSLPTHEATKLRRVEALALGLHIDREHKELLVTLFVQCDSADACTALREWLMASRFAASQQLGLRAAGFGGLIDALTADVAGATLTARSHADAEGISRAIERATQTLDAFRGPSPPARAPLRPASSQSPDEVIRMPAPTPEPRRP
jgi:hypothetical protein